MKKVILLALAIASTATATTRMHVVDTTDGVVTLQSERGDLFEIVDDRYTCGESVNVVMFTAWTETTVDDHVIYTVR